jgi:hypothetical protein
MSGDSSTINYPAQPSYGEGMRDALKAQVELLQGTGDFAGTGSLESLLPLEESIRKKTAQTDTDVLRQTLLGGETGGGQREVTYDDQGRAIAGYSEPGKTQIKAVVEDAQGNVLDLMKYNTDQEADRKGLLNALRNGRTSYQLVDGSGNVIGESEKISHGELEKSNDAFGAFDAQYDLSKAGVPTKAMNGLISNLEANENIDSGLVESIKSQRKSISRFDNGILPVKGSGSQDTVRLGNNQNSFDYQDPQPIFAKDTEGNVITDVSKAGTTETTTLPTFRTGDGMVDLLGDKRNVQDTVAREERKFVGGFKQTGVDRQTGDSVYSVYDDEGNEVQSGIGFQDIPRDTPNATETTETVYDQVDAGRQAGFATAEEGGGFLGLSALAEDLQAGNLSRQRERDLQDVARLSGTYQDIMEDYKPGTQEALESARQVLEGQKDALTGAGAIDIPTDSTFGGKVGGQTFDAATMGDAINLQAGTTYDPSLVSEKGLGYEAVAGLQGGQLLQNDPVRAALMKDAEAALGQGLTDREQRQIAEAARARSTMMGRTFDQSVVQSQKQKHGLLKTTSAECKTEHLHSLHLDRKQVSKSPISDARFKLVYKTRQRKTGQVNLLPGRHLQAEWQIKLHPIKQVSLVCKQVWVRNNLKHR